MNLTALGSGNFRTYFIGNIFALNALWMQRVTLGWLAWDLTGSASFVGLVALIQYAPIVVLGPLFGVWVDRINVRPAALATQSGNLLVTLVLFLLVWLGVMRPGVLLVLVAVTGTIAAAHNPVRMSLAPRLVPRELVASVVNLTSINFNLARLSGPAVGGVAIATLGVASSLLIQALCFLPFIFALTRLEVRPRRTEAGPALPFIAALMQGVRHVAQQPMILQAMLVTGTMTLVSRGVLEILPTLADGVFERGAAGLGMLTSAAGFGAVVGGFGKALVPPQRAGTLPGTALLAAWAAVILVAALGSAPNWTAALVLVGLIGLCSTIAAVSLQTAIQLELDDDFRGRVMSLWIMIAMGGASVGAGALGALADLIGLSVALGLAGGIVGLALGYYVFTLWRRGRAEI